MATAAYGRGVAGLGRVSLVQRSPAVRPGGGGVRIRACPSPLWEGRPRLLLVAASTEGMRDTLSATVRCAALVFIHTGALLSTIVRLSESPVMLSQRMDLHTPPLSPPGAPPPVCASLSAPVLADAKRRPPTRGPCCRPSMLSRFRIRTLVPTDP